MTSCHIVLHGIMIDLSKEKYLEQHLKIIIKIL